ncbi:MAG: helix-turn-helix transcriptional regulator [Acidimicrobiales bacterium]|jgi:transcriptional regulator with XRE-family HTH domain
MQGKASTTAGALVQLAREEAGLSQRELAQRAGVTQSDIARIETGRREPSIPTIQRILAGAGLELRFRLAPLEDHDRVLLARQARRSPEERGAAEARHRRNVARFAANARAKGSSTSSSVPLPPSPRVPRSKRPTTSTSRLGGAPTTSGGSPQR